MPSRLWYTVVCHGCSEEPRVFDLKSERNQWASDHVANTDDSHTITLGRTSNPPTYKPKVNCCLCIQAGTQSPAAAEVYGSAVCRDHVSVMQTAGVIANRGPGMPSTALTLAVAMLSHTKSIGKQED